MCIRDRPYLIQPFPDFLHVGLIGGATGVDPLGDLVNVPANGGQELVHLLNVPGVHIDDISVNRHLPQIGADALCLELGHLLFHQFLFLGGHIELHLDISFSVCHRGISPLFVSGFGMFPTSFFRV